MGTVYDSIQGLEKATQTAHQALKSASIDDEEAVRLMIRTELSNLWDGLYLIARELDRLKT